MSLRIVATLGPASRTLTAELHTAGATAFRLNASHMTVQELVGLAAAVRARMPDFPIVIDLQGAKMRLGHFPERAIAKGDRLVFSLKECPGNVPLPHTEFFSAVEVGDTMSFDDDRLRFQVTSKADDFLEAVSLTGGTLRARKGVNAREHPVLLSDLTEADRARIEATAHFGAISYAYSFMKDGQEAAWIRRGAPECPVIGKIERREAAEQAHRIAASVNEIWICRGDLGAQMGMAAMARWVSGYDPRVDTCPVLMAGQVLEHLTAHPSPTRAEVCHAFDLLARGYSGFVLSDETAIGADPVGAVRVLSSLNSF